MYEIQTGESSTSNILAGGFDIVTGVEVVAEDTVIRKHSLVAKGDDGATEATEETLDNIIGIAAEDSTEAGVVVYQTGCFQERGILFPDDVTADDVRDILRKYSIFIK